ncbi:MAG: hypothetical protein IPJ84_07440 [Bdellovibrionales bacterium]|nr:hypothetical protein [Bdellovibrionales bacterium]
MLVALEVAVGGISAAVQAVEYQAGDLLGSSVTCADRQQKYRGLAQCDLRQSSSSLGDIQTQLIRGEGEKLSRALRKDYFSQIETALTSQFQAATWLAGENLLRGEYAVAGGSLQKAIDSATAKCSGEERSLLESLSANFKNAKASDALSFASLPQEYADQPKEFVQKRMLIAWLEINRIERFLTDRPLSKVQKQELRTRLEKIRATYPLVATSHGAYTLSQLALIDYGQVTFVDSTQPHPQIDQILFPSEVDGKYAVIPAGKNKQQGHEGLVNQILAQPLTPRVEKEIRTLMVSSLKNSFESIGGLCQLNACQTMQLSLPTTASKINDMADESQNLTTAAACSCKLMVPTEMVGTGAQLMMAGTAIGGAVLCPFTLGMGCFVSAASTAGLTVASAANTYGAMKDLKQAKPIGVAARALPGLSNESRAAAKQAENQAVGRVIGGLAMTATGAISGSQMVRQGADAREVLSTAWRPANPSEMAGYFQTHVREVGRTARKIYKSNVEYFPHMRPDSIKALKSHDMEKFLSFQSLAERYGYRGVPKALVDDLADKEMFSHLVSKDGKYIEMVFRILSTPFGGIVQRAYRQN